VHEAATADVLVVLMSEFDVERLPVVDPDDDFAGRAGLVRLAGV
jgi:CBS domain-containing protein